MKSDIEELLAFGRMDLEAGYAEYARQYFERVLALDASNQEAIQGLERVDKALEHKVFLDSLETQPVKPASRAGSITGWIRKEREERARIVAERKRVATEKREVLEQEEMTETELAEDDYWQSLPTDLTELSQLQCKQLIGVVAELQKHRTILDKHTKDLSSIRSSASLLALIVVLAAVLSIVSASCSALLGPY